jgi:hypothetical protein
MTQVEQQAQELREDFKEIQATRQDIIQPARRDWEATTRDLESRLAAVNVRTRHTGKGNLGSVDAAEVLWNYLLVSIPSTVRGRGR